MKYSSISIAILIAVSSIGCDKPYSSTTDTATKPVGSKTMVDRDNSAVNKRDRDATSKTPIDQNENKLDIGITEYEAKRYEGKLKGGHCLVSVHSEDSHETEKAKKIFEAASAEDISTSSEASVSGRA